MKKTVLIIGVVIVIAAVGGGSYALLSNKSSKQPTTTASTTSTQASSSSTSTSTTSKHLNLNTILTNLKTKYPTVQQTYVYTTSMDPNSELGKAGGYTAGAEFYDTRTGYTPAEDGNTAFGAECGGAIEVYPTAADAASRVTYLEQYQNDPALNPGAVKQVDDVVVRASSQYTAAEQTDMINYLASQVQEQMQ